MILFWAYLEEIEIVIRENEEIMLSLFCQTETTLVLTEF